MTIEFYGQLRELLTQAAVVVATVTQTRGSAPREVGAKMLITEQQTVGTVGGGAGEAQVIQHAQTVLQTGINVAVEIDLSGNAQRQTYGVCGGWMQVWLTYWSGVAAIARVDQIIQHLQSGQPVDLIIPLSPHQHPEVQPSRGQTQADLTPTVIDVQGLPTFVEPLQPDPTLLIVGAGHVGIALAQIAHSIGFQIAVQDERADLARAARFPPHTILLPVPFAAAWEQLRWRNPLYVALVTRSYICDLEVLPHVLSQTAPPPAYIGMIGSAKRVHVVQQTLERQGVAAQQLRSLHAPIGLDIGALTPAEIAISICAELIQVRRGGTGQPLSMRHT